MPTNQITYELDYAEKRSRLTTFFRGLMSIPIFIVAAIFIFIAFIGVVIAWFALLITGKYPEGLYNFVASALRLQARTLGYYLLATDVYPPFDGGEHPEYPIRVGVPAPLDSYSRLKVFFRYFYMIPAIIINYALTIWAYICTIISWIVIIITGKQPKALNDGIALGLSYSARTSAMMYLLVEDYPGISYESGLPSGGSGGAPTSTATGGPEMPSVGI